MRADQTVNTDKELLDVLGDITFAPSCVNMAWDWEIEETLTPLGKVRGWFVNTTFQRPDTNTGKLGTGRGRREFIDVGTSVSGVVKTCWLLAELIVRHELMEAFLWKGDRIFDPHNDVDEMGRVSRERREYE